MENTVFSLLPPVVAIVLAIATRRVLLSLGLGILTAAVLLAEFQFVKTIQIILETIKNVFVSGGGLNTWNVYILLFLFVLGIITAFITISGGSRAFGEWAMKRVKTRAGAQLVTGILGLLIFIDDYFNALAVGQVSRPITDRKKVSRAKLAYLIDSTSAPICVLSPVSSWGAYIISILGAIIASHQIEGMSAISMFVQMIPMNFYAIAAIIFVFMVISKNINYGPMKKHEERAATTGVLLDPLKAAPGELKEDLPVSSKGKVGDLVWPIVVLFAGTITAMFITGYSASPENANIFTIFENTDVSGSLLCGGLFGLTAALISFFRQAYVMKAVDKNILPAGIIQGIKSMMPAVSILLLAWMIIDLIGQLETGAYLAGIVESSKMEISFLPLILFLIGGVMAFATGTSWGSFGILLPIAAEIAVTTDASLLLPSMAAVLAGSVLGDHSSPISDTTILSSTGAGCNHMDHVMTQLPYAVTAGLFAAAGYAVYAFVPNVWLSLFITLSLLFVFVFIWGKKGKIAE